MISVEHESSRFAEKLEAKARRLEDLTPVDEDARRLVVEENSFASFDASHESSVSRASNGVVEIGSKSKSYGRILKMPTEKVSAVYTKYVNGVREGG